MRGAKRPKSRQSFDLEGPAIGPPARKQDGVYRIFQPKGQTQIVRRKGAADLGGLMAGQCEDFATAVRGSVRGLDHPGGLAGPQGRSGFFEARDKHAFAPGKTQLVQTAPRQ